MNRFWVHERDLEPEHPLARLAVDQLGAARSEVGGGGAHVVDLVRDVMHARPALGQKPADRRVVAEGREQLDPVVTDADRCSLDTLSFDACAMLEPPAATVVAFLWLGESLGLFQLLGGAVVLAAIALAQSSR